MLMGLGAGPATIADPTVVFVDAVLAITGAEDTRLFWVAQRDDTLTSLTKDVNKHTVTWDDDVSARLSAQGDGYVQTFNGSDQLGLVPDAASLSFGDGLVDGPLSVVALANFTNTAATRVIVAKNGEYRLDASTADLLAVRLRDLSVGVQPLRASDAAITQGALHLFGFTYTAATGGATAANDITLYEDGASIASTATNQATYVAMEDTSVDVEIGALGGAGPMQGSLGFVLLTAKSLSAQDHADITALVNTYYDLAL